MIQRMAYFFLAIALVLAIATLYLHHLSSAANWHSQHVTVEDERTYIKQAGFNQYKPADVGGYYQTRELHLENRYDTYTAATAWAGLAALSGGVTLLFVYFAKRNSSRNPKTSTKPYYLTVRILAAFTVLLMVLSVLFFKLSSDASRRSDMAFNEGYSVGSQIYQNQQMALGNRYAVCGIAAAGLIGLTLPAALTYVIVGRKTYAKPT